MDPKQEEELLSELREIRQLLGAISSTLGSIQSDVHHISVDTAAISEK